MQRECLPLLEDPSAKIRANAGSLVSTIAFRWGIWKGLSLKLKQMMESHNDALRTAALEVLKKMWADCSAKELRKLTTLVIDHLPLLGHTNREIRFVIIVVGYTLLLCEAQG